MIGKRDGNEGNKAPTASSFSQPWYMKASRKSTPSLSHQKQYISPEFITAELVGEAQVVPKPYTNLCPVGGFEPPDLSIDSLAHQPLDYCVLKAQLLNIQTLNILCSRQHSKGDKNRNVPIVVPSSTTSGAANSTKRKIPWGNIARFNDLQSPPVSRCKANGCPSAEPRRQ